MSALFAHALLGGRYELLAAFGAGAFGEVWSAHDLGTGAEVAVKVMHAGLRRVPEAQRRFAIEARALSAIDHPNVVRKVGEGDADGAPYLALDLLRGGTLREWLRRHRDARRWPPLGEVARLFEQACAGVGAAHAASCGPIVHRDVKLANLLLDDPDPARAVVKVVDFSVAQLREVAPSAPCVPYVETASGVSLGSTHTMAPEQAAGRVRDVGPWTDVFSLGAVLVELLTLRSLPPAGVWWWALAMKDDRTISALLPSLRPDVPPAWWDVAAACLRASPEARFESANSLRQAFVAAACALPAPSQLAVTVEEHTASTVMRPLGR